MVSLGLFCATAQMFVTPDGSPVLLASLKIVFARLNLESGILQAEPVRHARTAGQTEMNRAERF